MSEKKFIIKNKLDDIYVVYSSENFDDYVYSNNEILFEGTIDKVRAWVSLVEEGYDL